MNRRSFLQNLARGAALLPAARMLGQKEKARKPNIVLILADDLGYGEIGQHSGIPTPNIDSISRNGVRFTSGYVSCPVCSPTRAGLMTGRYQERFGHEFNPGPPQQASDDFGLPLEEVTIADRLKSLGYSTGLVGKWHLGYQPRFHPQKRGFDEFFGFLSGAHPYFPGENPRGNLILRGTEPVDEKEYLTDAFAREAVSFIRSRKQQPFFLYLAFNAVHNPLQATDKYLSRFSSVSDPKRRAFSAMLSAMDDGVGRVLSALDDAGLKDDTLIFFLSDNGGPTRQTSSRNNPLRGYKGDVLEGGIRVPFAMQWKRKLPAGTVYEHPVIALDILPTAVAAAGGSLSQKNPLDGVDLIAHLNSAQKKPPHESLYWRFGSQSAIRKGDWKLAVLDDGTPQLYNLAQDIGESKDLASSEAGKLKELQADYQAWNSQLAAPRWEPRRRRRPRRPKRRA
ncbi:MAG: sulfatase [Bryobacteraceae bacterium]